MESLLKMNPELLLTLITFAGTVGRYLIDKIQGEKTASLKDKIWPVIEGTVLKLAGNEFVVATVRVKLEKAATDGLARMGIKKNRVVDAIVQELVEKGVTEVRKLVEARLLPSRAAALETGAAKVVAAFDKLTPDVPIDTLTEFKASGGELLEVK
jgi:hypothetical protein